MNQDREERRTKWPIRRSVVAAFVLGLLVCYVLSAGPMSRIMVANHSGLYGCLYKPLYFITDRLPDPMFDAFHRYIRTFGDEPYRYFALSRAIHRVAYHRDLDRNPFDHIPFPDDQPENTPSIQTR